jgi:Carboxypeptidase regulatory-like domain
MQNMKRYGYSVVAMVVKFSHFSRNIGETAGALHKRRNGLVNRGHLPQIFEGCLTKTAFMALIALGLLMSSVLSAQIVPTATLSGSVSDPTGAVVTSATVQIVNAETRVAQETTSDTQGRFLFSFLQPGSYQLNVSATGFSKYQQNGITLNVNAPATVNVHLAVQSATAEVVVNSNAEMIDTESGTLRQIVGKE